MNALWQLPATAVIGGEEYPIHADFRDVLEIIGYLDDPDEPVFIRWEIALGLFFEGEIPEEHKQEAIDYLADFLACGEKEPPGKMPAKVLDWEQDAAAIVADVNKAAGTEIRSLPFLHWWTFMAHFNAIGEGQLSTIVSIRSKLRKGKKLEKWERDYYRENKHRIDLKPKYSAEELAAQERLKALLGE